MASDDNLIPVFVPSLAQLLALHEEKKGSPLTEDEVRSLRDEAPCIMTPKSFTATQTKSLGFRDVNPKNCWADWQRLRVQLTGVGSLPKLVMCILGALESKAQFEQILAEDEVQHEFSERDTRMEEAFRAASCGRGSTLTPEDSQAIAEHSLVLYIISDNFPESYAQDTSRWYLRLGRRLLEAGAVAMKCETSGIAHGKSHWIELAAACEVPEDGWSEERLRDFWTSLLSAFVQFPIEAKGDLYTCGMHLLGMPDVIVAQSLMQEAIPDSHSIVDEAVYLFNAFCLYLLSECPEGEFAPGHSFQPDLEFPSFRLEWEPCQGYAEDDLSFNPYGRWRFAKLGKNAPNRGK
jgi:hypothetical protein